MVKEIKLGDTVKCKVSGFKGIVVARTEFINGCIQLEVQPKVNKKNEHMESLGIDIQSLEKISIKKKAVKKKSTGGANTKSTKMRGF